MVKKLNTNNRSVDRFNKPSQMTDHNEDLTNQHTTSQSCVPFKNTSDRNLVFTSIVLSIIFQP